MAVFRQRRAVDHAAAAHAHAARPLQSGSLCELLADGDGHVVMLGFGKAAVDNAGETRTDRSVTASWAVGGDTLQRSRDQVRQAVHVERRGEQKQVRRVYGRRAGRGCAPPCAGTVHDSGLQPHP